MERVSPRRRSGTIGRPLSAEQTYSGFDIVGTRYGQDGTVLSSVSAPSIRR